MSWFGHWTHHKDSDAEKKEKEAKKKRNSLTSFFSFGHHKKEKKAEEKKAKGKKEEKYVTMKETKVKEEKKIEAKEYCFSIHFCGSRNMIREEKTEDNAVQEERIALNDQSKTARAMRLYYPVRELVHVVVHVMSTDSVGTMKLLALKKLAEQTFQSGHRDARFTIVERALRMKDENERISYLSKEGFTPNWLRLFNKDGVEILVSNRESVEDLLHVCGEAVTFKSADFKEFALLMPFVPYVLSCANTITHTSNRMTKHRYVGYAAHEPAQFLHRDPCEVAIMNAMETNSTRTVGAEMCQFLIDSCHTVLPCTNISLPTKEDAGLLVGLNRLLALVTAIRECPKIIERDVLVQIENSAVSDMASFLLSTGKCGQSERNIASWLRRCVSYCDHVSMDVHAPTRDGTERLFVDPVHGNDADATGLSPENPLRSVKRAHDIVRRVRERVSKDEQSRNEASMLCVQNTSDADIPVTDALRRCEHVWSRLAHVPSESIFVKLHNGKWVSYELMTRTFAVATKIMDDGMNMAKIGHLALITKKVREKLKKESPFEMSEAHQCVSLWILDHALVQEREVIKRDEEKDDDDEIEVKYDVSFHKSKDSVGHPLYDARDVFKPPSIGNSSIQTKDRLIHVANSRNESVTLETICKNARFFDLSGHGIEHFSYIKNEDLSALRNAEKLQILSLAKNSMQTASLGSLETTGLRKLRVLDLSHNLLSKAFVTYLPCLEYLFLSHNKLRGSSLQKVLGTMKGCDSLRVLDLSFNNFDWTPSEFVCNIKYIRDTDLKCLENLVLHGNNVAMSFRCQRHAVRGRDRIDREEDGKITKIMNRIKNDWTRSEDGSCWQNKKENYVMFDEPDEYAEVGTSVVKEGKRMNALYDGLELTWPEKLPQIIVQSERVCARYDTTHVLRKIRRSRENYAVALQRARRVVLHSNRRNAFNRWRRITKLSQFVALRFWWNILKFQTRRARLACTDSLSSDPVVARLDASIVSIRDIVRTGRISLTVLGEIIGVRLGVAKSERSKGKGGGPVVIGARRRERVRLLRMRLVEIDGCEIRMNQSDIETNSIRVPDATLQALSSKIRTLLLQDPIYIVAGFKDPMMMVSDITEDCRYKPHWTHFARILYSVSCHNRYHHCKYVATRFCNSATDISDASKCPPTEFRNYNDIFQIREKGQTNSQIKRLKAHRDALELGHTKVPLPLLPDAHRSMSAQLCVVMRDLLQVSKKQGGLVKLALEIRRGLDVSSSTDTEFQDQVDMFLCSVFEASRCILREIGTVTTRRTLTELRKQSRSEAHVKVIAVQERVSMKSDKVMEISEQEYVKARMLDASSHMLARFCERVHETWKRTALQRWKQYVRVDKIEAARQEARWYNALARQHENRWADLNEKINKMKKNLLKRKEN